MNQLILLDLDNALIYSDYSAKLKVNKLFKYMNFLYVYVRPYAREFIRKCQEIGEVMIFTMAEWDYADQVSKHLNIQPSRIFSNVECINQEGFNFKSLPSQYYGIYEQIIIVDDYPEIWKVQDRKSTRLNSSH